MNFKATSKVRGDETQSFDVTDYKATTVGEFVGEVLSGDGKKEWGDFRIIKENGDWNKPNYCWNNNYYKYEYKRGELLETIPYDVFKCRIKNVTADGGWSNMDYYITVVEENESENEYCKQHCKGFQDTGGKCFVDDCRKNETGNDVRIGDRVFMDGTEVFKNIKGITYDTSGVSMCEDAETPIEKAKEICHCGVDCPNFEWCGDWCERLEQMSKMYKWAKQQFTKEKEKTVTNCCDKIMEQAKDDYNQLKKQKQQFVDLACESFCEKCEREDYCELTECLALYGFKEKLIKKLQL